MLGFRFLLSRWARLLRGVINIGHLSASVFDRFSCPLHVKMATCTLKVGVITLFYCKKVSRSNTARECLTKTVGFAFIGRTFALGKKSKTSSLP